MSVNLIHIGSVFIIDTDFHAVHMQSPLMDSLFLVLLVSYVFFLIMTAPYFSAIVKHPMKLNSFMSGIRSNIKFGPILWAKGMILLSVPILISFLSPFFEFSNLCIALAVIFIMAVMLLRHLVLFLIGEVTQRKEELGMVVYVSNCHVVFFTLIYVLSVVLSYSLKYLPLLPFSFIILYFIFHVVRIIKTLKEVDFYFFDIILYLCTFEILPLVIAILSILKIVD